MKLPLFVVVILMLAMAAPAFAGSVRINATNMAPTYANTGDLVHVLTLSPMVNASGVTNITQLNITINRIDAPRNISGIFVYLNTTGGAVGSVVGSNTSITANVSRIAFTTVVNISEANHTLLFVLVNVSKGATSRSTFNVSLNATADIEIGPDHNVHNLSTTNSSTTQIQHVHAIGTLTPRYVDTNVKNQSFVMYLEINGTDMFENLSIKVPSEYPIANVTGLSNSTTTIYGNDTVGYSPFLNITYGGDTINITDFRIGFSNEDAYLKINLTANTSAAAVASFRFNVTLHGSNLSAVNVTDNATGSMNTTTQQLITAIGAAFTKRGAIINGSDFWELNLTINITANVSGILQFRMNNWNSTTAGFGLLNITNETGLVTTNSANYALLRNTSSTGSTNSGQLNISTEYGAPTRGLALRYTGTTRVLILKMVIPLNTPTADDWGAAYFMLFRAET